MRSNTRPSVAVESGPSPAQLHAWGRDVTGDWWALIVWTEWVARVGELGNFPLPCAGWVPGHAVTLPEQRRVVDLLDVPRGQLGAEPAEWPPPSTRPGAVWDTDRSWYAGVLDSPQPQLPAGFSRVQGGGYG